MRVALLVCAALVGCAHAQDERALDDMEAGFVALSAGDEVAARAKLSSAHAVFDDLQSAGFFDPLFRPDAAKPYRGQPHERVLTASLLGVLDARAGRCDLALPAANDALRTDARWSKGGRADTALPALVGLSCARSLERESEIERFSADLVEALSPSAAHGGALEGAKGRARHLAAAELVVVIEDAAGKQRAFGDANNLRLVEVWSSRAQLEGTKGRAFDLVLNARKATKGQLDSVGNQVMNEATDPTSQVLGLSARVVASFIRPAKDTRKVASLPAKVFVAVPDPAVSVARADLRGRALEP